MKNIFKNPIYVVIMVSALFIACISIVWFNQRKNMVSPNSLAKPSLSRVSADKNCNLFSIKDYNLPGVTVKEIYKRAEKLGYVESATIDKITTSTLEQVNKDRLPQMQMHEGDVIWLAYEIITVKNNIVYFSHHNNVTIQKKVDDRILQIKLEDKNTGPIPYFKEDTTSNTNSTKIDLRVLNNSCVETDASYFTSLFKELYLELGIDPASVPEIPLQQFNTVDF